MAKARDRASVPVSLPIGLVDEIDKLVKAGLFASRSDAMRHAARLLVMFEGRLHARASQYAADEAMRRRLRQRSEG
jgi:Arc/MetJ-type ribon-helix-helix transcriptional regulator